MQKIALPLAAGLLALAALAAHAQPVWKWRDANGQMHIGDSPPPAGTPQKNILGAPSGGMTSSLAAAGAASKAADTPAPGASAPLSDLDKRKLAADRDKADKAKADRAALDQKNAAIRKDNCQRANAEVANLQTGGRIARMNASGEREILDDTQRAAELRRVQGIAAQSCGAAP